MAEILGAFEQAVLLALVRLGDEAYGRAIMKEVTERLEREVAAGAVHATLERLQKKELITSRLGAGTPVRSGRARHSGRACSCARRSTSTRTFSSTPQCRTPSASIAGSRRSSGSG